MNILNLISENCELGELVDYLKKLGFASKTISNFLLLGGPDPINSAFKDYFITTQYDKIVDLLEKLRTYPHNGDTNPFLGHYLNNYKDSKHKVASLLYKAVCCGNAKLVKSLLVYPELNVDRCFEYYKRETGPDRQVTDNDTMITNSIPGIETIRTERASPLFISIDLNELEIFELILTRDPDVTTKYYSSKEVLDPFKEPKKETKTYTCLQLSILKRNPTFVLKLLERGAGIPSQKVSISDLVKLNLDLKNIPVVGLKTSVLGRKVSRKTKGFKTAITNSKELTDFLSTNPQKTWKVQTQTRS